MKKRELEKIIKEQLGKENYVYLHDFLYKNFEVHYETSNGYTTNINAAMYNAHGSCTNSFLKCEDGYVADPF